MDPEKLIQVFISALSKKDWETCKKSLHPAIELTMFDGEDSFKCKGIEQYVETMKHTLNQGVQKLNIQNIRKTSEDYVVIVKDNLNHISICNFEFKENKISKDRRFSIKSSPIKPNKL